MKVIITSESKIFIEDYDDAQSFCDPKSFDKNEYLGNVVKIIRAFCIEGDLILFAIRESAMKISFRYKQLVKNNTMFITNEWINTHPKPKKKQPRLRWFKANSDEEKMQVIDGGLHFTCAILKKDAELNKSSYVLESYECIDSMVLAIDNRMGASFFNIVLPRIEVLKNGKLIIEDNRGGDEKIY